LIDGLNGAEGQVRSGGDAGAQARLQSPPPTEELVAYADMVTPGSYIVATDGIMYDLVDVPRGQTEWATDNPTWAARDFAATHPEFVIEQPAWPFNESELDQNITHWPGAWLKRV
jgi:cephalosporin hydroxylase